MVPSSRHLQGGNGWMPGLVKAVSGQCRAVGGGHGTAKPDTVLHRYGVNQEDQLAKTIEIIQRNYVHEVKVRGYLL
jgi:hypothetical protein